MKRNNNVGIIIFLLPAVTIVIIFFLLPLAFLGITSITNWRGASFSGVKIIGFKNYIDIFTSSEYWVAFYNTVIWASCTIFLHIPLCLIVAMILFRKPFGWKVLRTIYFFPHVISQYSLAWMWVFIYKPDIGVINSILRLIGLGKFAINWLSTPSTALGALILTWLFNVGFFTIIFLAQIGTIPHELYESAEIDGASEIQKEYHITVPMLKDTISICMLMGVSFTLKTFELPFVMTNGGPGTTTQILPLLMYKKFLNNESSLANAIGFTMVTIGIIAILLVKTLTKNKEGSLE